MPRLALIACLALIPAHDVCADPPQPIERGQLGRGVKLRILVDKGMQPTAGWVTQEWMVKATAEAGFNVLSPRHGQERLDEVRQVAAWCKQYGIYYMPWMRGSLGALAVILLNDQGRVVKWFGTATDIDDSKTAEVALRRYAERLETSNRNLQEFAFVASPALHEPPGPLLFGRQAGGHRHRFGT